MILEIAKQYQLYLEMARRNLDCYNSVEDKIWISKESLIKLTKLDGLSYITKERLLKELEGGEDGKM